MKITLADIRLNFLNINDILELIYKDSEKNAQMSHVISLNPETFIDMLRDKSFKELVAKTQTVIADGNGIVAAIRFLYGIEVPHVTGVDAMGKLLDEAVGHSLPICLIGGKPKVADTIAQCYSKGKNSAKIASTIGYNDVFNRKPKEENEISTIVSSTRPRIVFVSFGSPQQELWIDRHSNLFSGALVMGVGGAFDFLAKKVVRAPSWIRSLKLEWLFRLVLEPWRIRRQWKLIAFVCYVLYYKVVLLFKS